MVYGKHLIWLFWIEKLLKAAQLPINEFDMIFLFSFIFSLSMINELIFLVSCHGDTTCCYALGVLSEHYSIPDW